MKKTTFSSCLALSVGAIAFAVPTPARAAGTALDVQSGRGTGMASAVTGFIDDSSAIYYNPAGIAQGKIIDAQIGDSVIIPAFRYTTPGGVSTTNASEIIPPFQAYVSGGITDDLSIGVGVFTPYGSTINWPDQWVGKSQITTSSLATYDINPTVAYHLGPVRLGAGLQIVRATIDLKKKIETGAQEVSTELGGDAWGVGANVGAQVEAIKQYLLFGLHYRSQVQLDFSGNAHFDNVPVELQGAIHDQSVKSSLTNPDSIAFAVASRPIERLVLDAEAVWYNWSVFKSIDIHFPNDTSGTLSTSQPKNWSNTVNWRVGGEYTIDDSWRVRAGVLYDPSPSPANTLTPDIPDAARLNLAVGGSYTHSSGFRVDLGYQFLFLFRRTSTAPALPGDYDGTANIIGISVGYRTPRARTAEPTPATTLPPADLAPAPDVVPPPSAPPPVEPAPVTPPPPAPPIAPPAPAPVAPPPAAGAPVVPPAAAAPAPAPVAPAPPTMAPGTHP